MSQYFHRCPMCRSQRPTLFAVELKGESGGKWVLECEVCSYRLIRLYALRSDRVGSTKFSAKADIILTWNTRVESPGGAWVARKDFG